MVLFAPLAAACVRAFCRPWALATWKTTARTCTHAAASASAPSQIVNLWTFRVIIMVNLLLKLRGERGCISYMGYMGYMVAWVTWLHGLHGCMGYMVAWVTWLHGLHEEADGRNRGRAVGVRPGMASSRRLHT